MAAKLTRLTHRIAIQLDLVAESCTICSSRARRPVRKLLDTTWYMTAVVRIPPEPWAPLSHITCGLALGTLHQVSNTISPSSVDEDYDAWSLTSTPSTYVQCVVFHDLPLRHWAVYIHLRSLREVNTRWGCHVCVSVRLYFSNYLYYQILPLFPSVPFA
jgi:hypothetical protein